MLKLVLLVLTFLATLVSGNPTTTSNSSDVTTPATTVTSGNALISRTAKMSEKCAASLIDLDHSFGEIIFILQPTHYEFKNINDLKNNYCSKIPGWMKQVQAYRSCLPPFPKTIFNVIFASLKKAYKPFCFDLPTMNLALDHLKCIDKETKPYMVDVVDKVTALLNHIGNLSDINQVIPGLCCGTNHFLVEVRDEFDRICKPKSRGDTGEFITNNVKTILSDALDIMCGKFSTTKKCRSIVPELFDGILQAMENRKKAETTVIVPVLNIIEKLDGEVHL